MSTEINLRVVITPSCFYRHGEKNGQAWHMCDAYAELPGSDFPQKFEYFCRKKEEILAVGSYDVPVKVSIKDSRPSFELDYRSAKRVASVAAATAPAKATA